MKRSEMLLKLMEIMIEVPHEYTPQRTAEYLFVRLKKAGMQESENILITEIAKVIEKSPEDLEQAADVVLLAYEKYMKPPCYIGIFANGKKFNRATDQGRDTYVFNNWEPEQ